MTRLACVLVMLGGCGLYFDGGGGGGGTCNVPKEPAMPQLRDPQTGQCETISTSSCGPCEACPVAYPTDWASCDTMCLGRSEATCMATAGCQVEYLDKGGTFDYWGCFAVAPSGPVETSCDGLDAYSCSRHDNCIEVYTPSGSTTTFEGCMAEPAPPPPPPPPAACDTLTTEADCLARADCDTIYDGSDCTCDPSGCTCKVEVFARCVAR
jgi:hypothetical protein